MSDTLDTQLAGLARDLRVDVPIDLEAAVMARVASERAPSRPLRLKRWLAGLLVVLLGAGAAASPVGATILDWFGFHGVAVTEGQPPATDEPTPPAEPAGSLAEAEALAGFAVRVPEELGAPDGVSVSRDHLLVSLSWGTGADTIRLDQFRGTIEPLFWKSVDESQIVTLAVGDALWLPHAHHVSLVADDGTLHRLPPRLAAPTLVWPHGLVTLRLEGDLTLERATEIANSTD